MSAVRLAGTRIPAPGARTNRAPLGVSSARAATGKRRRAAIARTGIRAMLCMRADVRLRLFKALADGPHEKTGHGNNDGTAAAAGGIAASRPGDPASAGE